jgi:hypothetical protein
MQRLAYGSLGHFPVHFRVQNMVIRTIKVKQKMHGPPLEANLHYPTCHHVKLSQCRVMCGSIYKMPLRIHCVYSGSNYCKFVSQDI